MKPLTILSLGLGRDSMTILALLIEGKCCVLGKKMRLDQIDAVAFSDTGAEWDFTMALIPQVTKICRKAGVPFYWLKKPPMKEVLEFEAKYLRQVAKVFKRAGVPRKGYYPVKGAPELEGIRGQAPWRTRKYRSIDHKAELGGYHLRIPIEQEMMLLGRMATRSSKECTNSHKIDPIRELLSDLLEERHGMTLVDWGVLVHGGMLKPNRMLLGMAADEVQRLQDWNPKYGLVLSKEGEWPKGRSQRWGVRDVYPLVEAKITKAKEATILKRHGWSDVLKSGCQSCPFQSWHWFWVLKRRHPQRFADIVFLEKHSLKTRKKFGLGLMYVRGERLLEQEVYEKARSRLALWDMHRKKKFTPGFVRKLQLLDPYWPGTDSNLTLHQVAKAGLGREAEHEILSKGYERGCKFGDI